MLNTWDRISRLDAIEEKSEPKDRAVESIKNETEKSLKNTNTISELWDNFKQSNIYVIKILKKAKGRPKKLWKSNSQNFCKSDKNYKR